MHRSPVRARAMVLGLALFALALVVGCSKGSKVEGTVKFKGQPVAGAVVQLIDPQGMAVASGQTDADGKFKLLTSYAKDQIPSGTYKVVVTKTSTGGTVDMDTRAKESAGKGDPTKDYLKSMLTAGKQKSELPEKFASEKTTTLSATIPTSGPLDLDLGS